MRIVCPACNAAYQVPDERLSAGKLVRCARCGTDWAPIAPVLAPESQERFEPEPEAPEASPPEELPADDVRVAPRRMALDDAVTPEPVTAAAASVAPHRTGPWLPIAWVASVALVAGAIALLVVQRDRVMQAWPPATRGYAAVGLVTK